MEVKGGWGTVLKICIWQFPHALANQVLWHVLYPCLLPTLTWSGNPSPLFFTLMIFIAFTWLLFFFVGGEMGNLVRRIFCCNASHTDATCIQSADTILLLNQCFLQKEEQEYHSYHVSLEISSKIHCLLLMLISLSSFLLTSLFVHSRHSINIC